jgi:hypothetical protein
MINISTVPIEGRPLIYYYNAQTLLNDNILLFKNRINKTSIQL